MRRRGIFRARIAELEAKLKTEKKLHYLATRLIQERDARLELMGAELASAYASAAAIAEHRAKGAADNAHDLRWAKRYEDAIAYDRVEEELTWAADEIRKLASEAPNEET